jgi:hypothetical protein
VTRAGWSLVAAGLLAAAACTHDDAGPAPTTQPTEPTSVVDRSGIALAGVPGATTSTIVEHGTAVLTGSVQGPAGPVVGATVRIERLVAGREIRTDVLTGPDGRFVLGAVPGGRYRVRAFLAPSLAQLTPVVRFLADGEEHAFDLVVEQQSGLVVRANVAPKPPLLDDPVNLVAVVATRSVGADGIVRSSPVVGATVELVGLGPWQLRDDGDAGSGGGSTTSTSVVLGPTTSTTARRTLSPNARTDAGGRISYQLRCTTAGSPGLALRIPVTVTSPTGAPQVTTETVPLDLPDCVDPAATTTTTGPTTTTQP